MDETSQVQTMRFQNAANRVMRGVLRTPLLSRLAGKRLLIIYVVGRKTGRRYAVPVAYARDGDRLLVGTPFGWARNLRSGEPVDIRLRGRRRPADVEVIRDEAGVTAGYALMCRENRQFAKFNRIGYDEGGRPSPADLHAAWASGGRVLRLHPR